MSDVCNTFVSALDDVLVLFDADDTVDAISVVLIALPIVLSEMRILITHYYHSIIRGAHGIL